MKYHQADGLVKLIAAKWFLGQAMQDEYRHHFQDMPYVPTARAVDFYLRNGMSPPTVEMIRTTVSKELDAPKREQPPPRSVIARQESARWASAIREAMHRGELPTQVAAPSTDTTSCENTSLPTSPTDHRSATPESNPSSATTPVSSDTTPTT